MQCFFKQACHQIALVGARLLGMVAAALAHGIAAQGRVRHLRADIDHMRQPLQRIEVLRKALPVEGQTFGQYRPGDVLDAFHQIDQEVGRAAAQRRESYAAVAKERGGHSMDRGRSELRIPDRLPVVMGMDVDEARCQQQPLRIDFSPPAPGGGRGPRAARISNTSHLSRVDLRDALDRGQPPAMHCRDGLPVDGHIGDAGGGTCTVDQGGTADHQFMGIHGICLLVISRFSASNRHKTTRCDDPARRRQVAHPLKSGF